MRIYLILYHFYYTKWEKTFPYFFDAAAIRIKGNYGCICMKNDPIILLSEFNIKASNLNIKNFIYVAEYGKILPSGLNFSK